jgi:hypothetical protein
MAITAQLTQQQLLDILESLLPAHYIEPIKNIGPGWELLQMAAKVGERLSLAVHRLDTGARISDAVGGAKATATITVTRPNAASGEVTVLKGTAVNCRVGPYKYKDTDEYVSGSYVRFVLDQDVVFSAIGLIGVPDPVGVTAEVVGYDSNVVGPYTTADGTPILGEIDSFAGLHVVNSLGVPYGDPNVEATQVTEATGGTSPFLDLVGADRGLTRIPAESDGDYRARVRRLVDTVSPNALKDAANAFLANYNATLLAYIETWRQDYQTCWDGPNVAIGLPWQPGGKYNPSVFVYDAEGAAGHDATVVFHNRWLDTIHQRNGVIMWVPNLAAIQDYGGALDDTAANPAAHVSPTTLGVRCHTAFDLAPGDALGGAPAIPVAFDGVDIQKAAVYKGLWDVLQAVKAAGVMLSIELQGA